MIKGFVNKLLIELALKIIRKMLILFKVCVKAKMKKIYL